MRALLLALACCASTAALAADGVLPLPPSAFAYPKGPVQLEEKQAEQRGDVTIHDVRFKSPSRADPVKAYLVVPKGEGPFAGVLFVHWLGDPKTTNRTQFLDEAVGMARRGTISLLVDGMWAAPRWYGEGRKHATDYADAIAQVKELQRAMDVLLAQPRVDPKRVAFVGHDFGAMYGVLMGAAEPRARTYVLLAPTVTFHEWFLLAKKKPKDVAGYVRQMAPLDVNRYLPRLDASVFLQFAKKDEYVPTAKAEELAASTPEPKLVRTYDNTDHTMTSEDGRQERFRWLAKELKLPVN